MDVISMKTVDMDASKRVAELVCAQVGRCVSNVVRAFLYFRDALPENIMYVEGLWTVGGQTDIHVWIESDEAIIDPTLIALHPRNWNSYKRSIPIKRLGEQEVIKRYEGQSIEPGVRLDLILEWPDVEAVRKVFDPP